MRKFYVIGLVILVIIVGVFKVVSVKENGFEAEYDGVYLEENVLVSEENEVEVEKIKIHIIGEVASPRDL